MNKEEVIKEFNKFSKNFRGRNRERASEDAENLNQVLTDKEYDFFTRQHAGHASISRMAIWKGKKREKIFSSKSTQWTSWRYGKNFVVVTNDDDKEE